jgi:hypothetical protein
MRPGIQGLLLTILLINFWLLINPLKGNDRKDDAGSIFPDEIQSPYKYSLRLRFRISNDSAYLQLRTVRTGSTTFGFGTSNFVVTIDTSLFDISNAKIVRAGPWDGANNASYNPMGIGYNLSAQTLSINVVLKTNGGLVSVPLPSANDTLIAEVYLPAKKCRGITIIDWKDGSSGTLVRNWKGEDITSDKSTQAVIAYNTACPCNAFFSGLDTSYCTASLYSRLIPRIPGGTFSGPGVNHAAGIWYFKPFDAGPGIHTIKYVVNNTNCKDTMTMTTMVKSAPCITTASKDSSSGFTYLPTPQGIYTDCNGQVYTTSAVEHKVFQLDTFGIKHTIGGTGIAGYLDGPMATSLFDTPTGLVVDNSTDTLVYVIDSRNFCVRVINVRLKTVSTLIGTPKVPGSGTITDDGTGLAAKLVKAVGIAFSTDYKYIYISENDVSRGVQRIRMVDLATRIVTTIAGSSTGDIPAAGGLVPGMSAHFRELANMSCDDRFLYFADSKNNKIRKLDLLSPTHEVQTVIGNSLKGTADGDSITARFDTPYSATVGINGNIYVADGSNNLIREIVQYPKKYVTTISGYLIGGKTDSTFTNPVATSVFVKGFIDVADYGNDRIRRIAIQDYGNKPFLDFDTVFCYNGEVDTLSYIVGNYSGPGVYQSGGRWLFDPKKVTPGPYQICYSYNLNSCNATFCKTIVVNPIPRPTKITGGIMDFHLLY